MVDGKTTVFYVDSAQFLVSLVNKVGGDKEFVQTTTNRRGNYGDEAIQVDDQDVKSTTKDIAAISYKLPSDGADKATRV